MKPISVKVTEADGKTLIMANNVQISYPRVWEAEVKGSDTFHMGCVIMFDKAKAETAAAVEIINIQINNAVANDFNGVALAAEKICLKDGDLPGAKARYAGHWYMSANQTNGKIVVFTPGGSTPMTRAEYDVLPDHMKLTDGCIGSVKFQLWTQNNKFGKRVNGECLAMRWSDVGSQLESDSTVSVETLAGGFEDEEVGNDDW